MTKEDVFAAMEAASRAVAEGNVGGGTGMICHDFRGGIGTSSRGGGGGRCLHGGKTLVQASYGDRSRACAAIPWARNWATTWCPLPKRVGGI
ncbi:MAG: P1 family peptidase [Caldilineaceae bacterium]